MQFKINLEGNREETIIETCKNVQNIIHVMIKYYTCIE